MDQDPSEDFVKSGKHNFEQLEYLDLRGNSIERIDKAILLAPKLKTVLFGGNNISELDNLTNLPELNVIELSDNAIEVIDDLHTKLGQLTRLDLANNKIRNLSGCIKLYSLLHLNVAGNRIHDLGKHATFGGVSRKSKLAESDRMKQTSPDMVIYDSIVSFHKMNAHHPLGP